MSFRAFRNIFRNILKLDISRVAQSEGKIAGETVNAPTSQLVRSGPKRPSTRRVVQSCSRFFNSCRGNDLIGRIVKSPGSFLLNSRRFTSLPLFGAFAFAYNGSTEEGSPKADIVDLFFDIKETNKPKTKEPARSEATPSESFADYELKERLGKPSSSAAVYSAVCNNQEFAVKIMFNYEISSNSYALLRGFRKECRVLIPQKQEQSSKDGEVSDYLPEHPNIIKILKTFDEENPYPEDAISSYPVALPPRLSSEGLARNRTLCLVMPKYDCTLRDYVENGSPSERGSALLLAQLLEGVAHLVDHKEAHRDLKSDNILLALNENKSPKLVITDFGCCLADRNLELKLPLESPHVDRGGNSAMMAPEIASKIPGPGKVLGYSKSDLWACGALAYEIFGHKNPFTTGQLDNRFYEDGDLPDLVGVHPLIEKVVKLLLRKDPVQRPTASEAAMMMFLLLYAPESLVSFPKPPVVTEDDVVTWLSTIRLSTSREELKLAKSNLAFPVDLLLRKCLLRRANCRLVLSALAYLGDI